MIETAVASAMSMLGRGLEGRGRHLLPTALAVGFGLLVLICIIWGASSHDSTGIARRPLESVAGIFDWAGIRPPAALAEASEWLRDPQRVELMRWLAFGAGAVACVTRIKGFSVTIWQGYLAWMLYLTSAEGLGWSGATWI